MLTERQRIVLEEVARLTESLGWPPTIREIGESLGISSTNGVRQHLKALEQKGYLIREPGTARGIRLIGE